MRERPDVLFSLTGDVRRNSRAIRQLDALLDLGLKIEALTFGPEAEACWRGIRLHVLPRPTGSGPTFFAAVHRLFRKAALGISARMYHASDLFTLPAMCAAAHAHRGRLLYDARELYPHVGATAGKPWARLFWFLVERHYISRANAVFAVSESIAQRLSEMYGIPRPTLVYNAPDLQPIPRTSILRDRFGITSDLAIILYQGYLKRGRGCELLLDAMRDIERAVLVFMGEGDLEARLRAAAQHDSLAGKVFFADMALPDDLLPITASADIGACLIEDLSLSLRYALPNKLFEYLMAGVPVLGSDLPEIRRVIETFDTGRVVHASDRTMLVETLQGMVDDVHARLRWSTNTRSVFQEYGWAQSAQRFKAVYERQLNCTSP